MLEFITKSEKLVLEHLANAYKEFSELEIQHPDDLRDFVNAIHICQQLVAIRVARRVEPDVFPSKADIC